METYTEEDFYKEMEAEHYFNNELTELESIAERNTICYLKNIGDDFYETEPKDPKKPYFDKFHNIVNIDSYIH